jgi:hypothetical protein
MSSDDNYNFQVEQKETSCEIIQLLVNAGYFRAKINGLDIFDKVTNKHLYFFNLFFLPTILTYIKTSIIIRLWAAWFGVFPYVPAMSMLIFSTPKIQL